MLEYVRYNFILFYFIFNRIRGLRYRHLGIYQIKLFRVLPVPVLLLKLCVWLLLRSPPDRAPSIEIHVELKGVLSLSEFLCLSSSSHRDRDTHYSICYHYCTAHFKRSLVNLYDIHC